MRPHRQLAREQLQHTLARFRPLSQAPPPPKGWIRAVRDALGMSGRQLGARMGVNKQRVSAIERQELDGSLTLKTMRRAAEALDCVFVYGLVPRSSLDEIVRDQARRVATERLARAAHTMSLEEQGLGKDEDRRILSDLVESLVDEMPASFWDK